MLVYFEPIGNMSIHAKQFMVWQLLSSMKNKYGYKKDNIDNNPLDDGYAYRFKMNYGSLILVLIVINTENQEI